MDRPESFIDSDGGMSRLLVDSVVEYAMYLLELDGTIKSWNAGAQRIKGYSAKEIVGSNFSRFYTDEDIRAGEPARSLEIARSVGRFEAQGWRVRKDGTRLWADVVIDVVRNPAGEVVGFAKVTRDLTRRALRPVTKDDGSAKVLVDNILDYAVFLLDLDGTVKSWNIGAERIKGYSAQEIIGANFSVFYTADDVSAGEPIRCLEIARTTGRFEGTGWRVRKDRKRIWVNVVIDVVRDSAGAVVGFAKITRDLTQSAALRAVSEENGSIAQTLVDNVVDYAIYLIDLDGMVKSWNAGAQRIKGYSAEEIIGCNFSTFFTDDDVHAGEPVRSLAIARTTGHFAAEGWRVRKDRTRLWASVIIDPVRDPAGEVVGFAKVTRDITQSAAVKYLTEQLRLEREQFLAAKQSAQEAAGLALVSAERDRATAAKLLEQNRLMTMAEEMVKVGYWRFDLRTQEVHWSDEVYRIHGWDHSRRPTLESVLAAYHDDDRQFVSETIERAISEGTSYHFEARVVRPDGAARTVVANGQVVLEDDGTISGLFGAIQDITERREIEHERERLIVRVGLATQAAQVGIWDWDIVTNALVWDPMMFALYGFDDAQFSPVYECWTRALHPDDRARAEREIALAAQTGTPFETEFRIVWPDGGVHHIQTKAAVLCDEAGAARRMIGTNWDITEVRRLAEELRLAADRDRATAATLVEANRLMSMAEQMAHIAHWRIDVATNEMVWSDELYRVLGWPKSSPPLVERAIECYHPDDRGHVRDAVGRALTDGTPMGLEARIAHADGSYRDVICSGQAERAEDGAIIGILGICKDITERKEAERERERLTLRVGLATQSARVGIWDWDMVANSILCDPIMHMLYGFAEADFFPEFDKWLAAVHDDDRERVSRELAQAASSSAAFESEFRIVWPNADVRHIRATATVIESRSGVPERMIGTNWDVTEVRTLNAQLQQEKGAQERLTARVNLATSAAQIGIWEWDVRTGAVDWDPIMYRIFGVDPEQGPATYQTWAAAVHADDRERAEGELGKATANSAMFDSEFRVVWPDGQVRNVRAVAVIIRDASGGAERMIGTNWDITEARTLATQLGAAAERDRVAATTLQEKNRLLAMAEEMAHVGHWRLNVQTSEVFWSDEMYRTFDWPKTFQPTLRTSIAAYHADDRERVLAGIERAISTGSKYRNESRIVRPDGSIRYVVSISQPEFASDGSVIALAGAFQDVTEAKDAERERLGLLERVRAAAQAGKVGIWEWDLLTDGVVWDATMFALYGLSEQEPQTADLWKRAFHPDDEQSATRAIADALHGRSLLDVEYRVLWPNGETHHLRCRGTVMAAEAGKPLHMLGTAWDVTEVRKLSLQLLEEKERLIETVHTLETIVAATQAGTWQWNMMTKKIIINTYWAQQLGYTLEELGPTVSTATFETLVHPADIERVWAEVANHVEGRTEMYDCELRMKHRDGHWVWLIDNGRVMQRTVDGKPEVIVGLHRDITRHKELTDQLLEEKERLLKTVDMWMVAKQVAEDATRAKSMFLANMSHEIRSPMNAILGMLQLLQATGLSARQTDYAAKARVATQTLLRVLNDILDFSKIEAGKLTLEKAPFEIDAMMGDVSTLLSASLGAKPVELVFANDAQLPKRLLGDAFRLRQVLLNLAGNAIKFTAQGEIMIEIRQVAQGPNRCDIEFAVSDTGIGIAPEALKAIFEGFNQAESSTTRRYGGTGLGLAISQHIVSLMGGQLNVESGEGNGSRFHFTLTFDRTDDPAVPDLPRGPELPSTRHERVLIVDDNEHARTVLTNIVASFGWTGDAAGSGCEALELIGRQGAGRAYGLVFIDWMMPDLDGWETSRRIRELLPADDVTIVVMASAHDLVQLSARMESDPHVVNALLAKPLTASSLLNSLLEQRSQRDAFDVSQPPPNAHPRLRALKVLVVDDFAINLQIAGELLSLEGAEVEIADCAQEAIDKVLRSQPPFDVVLMDVQMPETDGYETTRRLRELPGMAGIPVIAMTANAMETDKAACVAAGMDDHIPKPIDIAVVVDTILTHCRPSHAVGISPIADSVGNPPDGPGMLTTEVDAALRRLGNNRQLFATLAGRFIEKSDSVVDELRASLQNGAITSATRLLHQLKGFAGTIGNVTLGALASRLETQVKETGCLSDPDGDLAEIATLLEAGNAALRDIIATFRVAATSQIITELDSITIETTLEEIDALLAAANTRAVSVCSELVRNMDTAGARRLAPLVQAIERFDFLQARAEMAHLLPAFNRTPGNRSLA